MTMPPNQFADFLNDRQRLRRKLSFWRVSAFLALFIAVGVVGWRVVRPNTSFESHIARISIEGLITGDRETLKLIQDVSKSHATAVLLNIESPGGTTTGSERVYDELRLLSAKKPVVAVVGSVAASGAYIAALGSDRIFSEGNSLVGSIGVLFQFPNVSKLLNTIGVQVESVKSAPLKAAPNGLEPTSPEARAALASLVTDSFDWFKGRVKTRRNMTDAELVRVSDGRVFTGRQAIDLKLIDELGNERAAIAWLEREKGIAKDLPIRDWKKPRHLENLGLLGSAASLAEMSGFNDIAGWLRRGALMQENHVLDGLLSVWQGGVVN